MHVDWMCVGVDAHRYVCTCVPVWSVKLKRHLGYCFSGPITLTFEADSLSLV